MEFGGSLGVAIPRWRSGFFLCNILAIQRTDRTRIKLDRTRRETLAISRWKYSPCQWALTSAGPEGLGPTQKYAQNISVVPILVGRTGPPGSDAVVCAKHFGSVHTSGSDPVPLTQWWKERKSLLGSAASGDDDGHLGDVEPADAVAQLQALDHVTEHRAVLALVGRLAVGQHDEELCANFGVPGRAQRKR